MRLTLAALPALCLFVAPVAAQPVIDFGGQVPCRTWLTVPEAQLQGNAWIFGFWSGMNVQAALDDKPGNIGHTVQPQDILREVLDLCRRDPTKPMALVAAAARAKVLAEGR